MPDEPAIPATPELELIMLKKQIEPLIETTKRFIAEKPVNGKLQAGWQTEFQKALEQIES